MWKQLKICLLLFIALSLLTGVIYPVLITGLAQLVFPSQASGSLIRKNGMIVGSELIGQQFEDPRYFWGRLSATTPAYNGAASSGSNLGPSNPRIQELVQARLMKLHDADPSQTAAVPVDLVTASGSGLDPNISIAAAIYQKNRIARIRGIPPERIDALIRIFTIPRFLGLLGEPSVNILKLNLTLDEEMEEVVTPVKQP